MQKLKETIILSKKKTSFKQMKLLRLPKEVAIGPPAVTRLEYNNEFVMLVARLW